VVLLIGRPGGEGALGVTLRKERTRIRSPSSSAWLSAPWPRGLPRSSRPWLTPEGDIDDQAPRLPAVPLPAADRPVPGSGTTSGRRARTRLWKTTGPDRPSGGTTPPSNESAYPLVRAVVTLCDRRLDDGAGRGIRLRPGGSV